MKRVLTLAIVAAGTAGFATASLAEGCNWHRSASLEVADNATPVPEETVVEEAIAEATEEATIETAQAPAETATE